MHLAAPPATRHSLWLLPPAAHSAALHSHICALADRYEGPAFEPHVTLLGSIPGERRARITQVDAIVAHLQPVPMTLTRLDHEPTWNRCLVVRIPPEPSLVQASRQVRDALDWRRTAPFQPHLSLFYALSKPERGARIMATLTWSPISFVSDHLSLVDTSGPVHTWKEVHRWRLRRPSRHTDG